MVELEIEAHNLARQLFGDDAEKHTFFTRRLIAIYEKAQDKDVLIIHNPGGWGNTLLDLGQSWEKSLVEGVGHSTESLGYKSIVMQYFRTADGWWEIMKDLEEQARYFAGKARIMAAELDLVTKHLKELRVVMVGVSQGAALSNAVLQYSGQSDRLCSIEVGLPFPYQRRRVVTEKTLILNSNGVEPDAVMEWDIIKMSQAFFTAPVRWMKYRFQHKPKKFSYCINVPGHDYNWDYPEVQRRIEDFFTVNFGTKKNKEVDVS